jgi:hypothetical protein
MELLIIPIEAYCVLFGFLQEKMGKPVALTVITANGFACRRKDGVNVIPLQTLTA